MTKQNISEKTEQLKPKTVCFGSWIFHDVRYVINSNGAQEEEEHKCEGGLIRGGARYRKCRL
jgi:hypothetical protein